MKRRIPLALCLLALLPATPAAAWWGAGGSGLGNAATDVLPAGNQPAASSNVQTVTVTWTQTTFHGSFVGAFANGGYTVLRYPAAGGAAQTPGGTCAGTISGATASLSCQDPGVAIGSWKYTVKPMLGTWTGNESPLSATVVTTIPAPTLSSPTAQNPTAAQTTGDVALTWTAVTGASGYNVYRRTASGSYNFATPLNGATPVAGTSYTDSGGGLASGTTYDYVVRAVQASPAAESPSSAERSVTPWSRPSAPSSVTATPQPAAAIAVSWPAVSGVAGYNVYRRTSAGSYNFASPLNGATLVSGTTYTDSTATNGTTYLYVVRAVILGAGSAKVESASSTESAAATADSVAPSAPTSVTVGAGAGPLQATATCSITAGTRFVNAAGDDATPITVVLPTPETGETIVLSATTPGSSAVTSTVAATGTTVNATMNLTSLLDGVVTLTARTADAAGNQSATVSPTTVTRKDTVATLNSLVYTDKNTTTQDLLAGTSECGARITAVETTGPTPGATFPTTGTVTVGTANTFTNFKLAAIPATNAYAYDVTATDLAANATTVAVSGTDIH